MKKLMVTLIAALVAVGAFADTWTDTDTGYTWTYQINGDTAEIYNGGSCAISPSPTGSVMIPSMLGGKPVTSIGSSAFVFCSGLTSVTIPDSVTSIGDYAFYFCSGLTSVTIPDSVTYIGWCAFDCSGLTSVMIGCGVTNIRSYAFGGNEGSCRLTSISLVAGNASYSMANGLLLSKDGKTLVHGINGDVTIPDGVTSIGYGAFPRCEGLTSVTIPAGVMSIGDYAFHDCYGLTSVTIPDGVANIGDYVFMRCDGLTSVVIPDSVTNIGYDAFRECEGLAAVTIGSGVTNIGDNAFQDCSRLGKVTFRGNEPSVDGNDAFYGVASYCTVYVPRTATFNVDAGGGWMGMKVEYYDLEDNPVTPDPVVPAPVTPGYEVIDEKDIVAPYDAPKAVVLQGAAYDGNGAVVGIVELKLGKVSKGSGKLSGSFVGLDGKKRAIKAPKLTGVDGASPVSVALDVKDLGTMNVTIGGEKFAGSLGGYHVQSANVGGNWSKSGAKVYVEAASETLPAGTLEDLLPVGEPVVAAGGKWKFEKAASVKWAKPKKGAAQPEIYDEASGKGLVVDTTKGKNLSGLKLTYTPKKGTFKGSFNAYALEGTGSATKLKKYKLNVSGVVVNGTGYGTAVCKNPALNWAVTVR